MGDAQVNRLVHSYALALKASFMRSILTFLLTVLLLSNITVLASASEVGVMWKPNGSASEQVQILRTMADHHIRHVRALNWPHEDALQAAATLQIRLYVDMKGSALPPKDRLEHPAVYGIGWAGPLTAEGCAEWAQLRSQLPSDRHRYVAVPVSPRGVACRFNDDTVLLADVRLMDRPFARWYQWQQAHDGPVGIAALGSARSAPDFDGQHAPRSPSAQARMLERLLTEVHTRNVPLTFVAAWTKASNYGPLHFHLTERNSLLPAGQVLARATISAPPPLAWQAEPAPSESPVLPPGMILLVWVLLGGGTAALIYVPPLQRTVLRYLFAHAFYREAVRTGRDATPLPLTILIALLSGALWIGGFAVLTEGVWLRPTVLMVETLPSSLSSLTDFVLAHPARTAGLVAAGIGASTLLWTSSLTLALYAVGTPLSWPQVLVLGLMPWWGTLVWMLAAIVPAFAWTAHAPLLLIGVALIASAWTALRTAYDVYRTARVPLPVALGAALGAPGSILLIAIIAAAYMADLPIRWLFSLLLHA